MEAKKYLSGEEIATIISANSGSGMRYTVELYLLDYIKHCFLEENQLDQNIAHLEAALEHLPVGPVGQGVTEVIESLKCVRSQYKEYLEDMKLLAEGKFPGSAEVS